MIIVYHKNNKVVKVIRNDEQLSFLSNIIATALLELAKSYPLDWLIWCEIDLRTSLNHSKFKTIFHHHKIMASYTAGAQNYISNAIGYVEESPFIKVNKSVIYPTWLMSSEVGGIHASVLNVIGSKIKTAANFDYFLNSVAKLGMLAGLFCYSEPGLLSNNPKELKENYQANNFLLFRFVKQHYKKRWLLLLLLNLFFFEKRFPMIPFFYALFFKNRKRIKLNLDAIQVQSTLKMVDKKTIDVIIPTIGRKQYLYDVLQDLAKQTHLPEKVIIVEQNPLKDSVSELDYFTTENWPFTIKHIFTHQTGVCNARNLALEEVESEWVFMADDDIRFKKGLFQNVLNKIEEYSIFALTTSCLKPDEIQHYKTIHQSGIFGSGNSFVKKEALDNVRFDKALEFGYGEDTDFGLQLRNQGHDVIYFPDLKITHLKAPMGGFRIPIKKQWESEAIQPKPSPTILYVLQKHYTLQQLKSYKLILFLKLLKHASLRDFFCFYRNFKKRWSRSVYWAGKLREKTK
ncbi:glycosyltransferase family 2 protein [Flavobacterium undicola]|uniref:glycosyltransferase family 2 protein n=1 Tax=Flavobacterium undicola TaxID=1932779 RepID=UPI001377A291|nr:glycosyltransferase family A protein [Flavobacterium undicola]MBA0884738.1 glycosyltransferase family 2 protein [Flavobacterium undicola]